MEDIAKELRAISASHRAAKAKDEKSQRSIEVSKAGVEAQSILADVWPECQAAAENGGVGILLSRLSTQDYTGDWPKETKVVCSVNPTLLSPKFAFIHQWCTSKGLRVHLRFINRDFLMFSFAKCYLYVLWEDGWLNYGDPHKTKIVTYM